jgi:hypothetical protein
MLPVFQRSLLYTTDANVSTKISWFTFCFLLPVTLSAKAAKIRQPNLQISRLHLPLAIDILNSKFYADFLEFSGVKC